MMNEGQKLVWMFTKMARASNANPIQRRYLIMIFIHFMPVNFGGKDKALKFKI
jgi:hypothetical protein